MLRLCSHSTESRDKIQVGLLVLLYVIVEIINYVLILMKVIIIIFLQVLMKKIHLIA